MKTTAILVSVMALASQAFAAPTGEVEKRSLVFSLASEKNGQGVRKSWVMDRWKCRTRRSSFTNSACVLTFPTDNLTDDNFDNEASWAFVDVGLANGCTLYE
jgi:hypothetical protein